jgi:RNA polymerase sigma factor for flagellar operon FliA
MIAPKSYNEQKHDPAKLVEENMALVQRLAWHFQGRVGRFVEIEDLLQAGYLGLIEASQRYSVREGVTFAAYAAIRIRGAIIDLLRRNSNLCRSTITMRQTIERTRRDLTQKLGRAPDPEQVAEAAGLTTEELLEWENRFQVNQLQSLDEVYTDHSLIFESAEGAAEDKLEMTQLKGVLKLCIEKLPEREAMVLQFYYVEELNVYEIAAILNVTTGRVSQIKKAAVERLRTLITAQIGDV